MLRVLARLCQSFVVLRGADENTFSFSFLSQQLPLLSYPFFAVSMEEGKERILPSVTDTSAVLTAAIESNRFFIRKCKWKLCLAEKGIAILRHVRSIPF